MIDVFMGYVEDVGKKNFISGPDYYELDCSEREIYKHVKQCFKFNERAIKAIEGPLHYEDGTSEIWLWRISPVNGKVVGCCYRERRERR